MSAAGHHGSAGLKKPGNCANVARAELLDAAQRMPGTVYTTLLTTGGLKAICHLAMTDAGRSSREHLTGQRCRIEDLLELARRGWVKDCGTKTLEITDEGNRVVRHLLQVAREWNGGGA